jgi:hypothetical protein
MRRTGAALLIATAICASSNPAAAERDSAASERFTYSFAYLGELLLHPGVLVGIEAPLARSQFGWSEGRVVVGANVGTYDHVRNHVGVLLDAEAGYRLIFRSGFAVEAFAGLGYLHAFLAAPVYSVGDDQKVDRITDFGRPAFMPVLGLGTEWRLRAFAPFLRFVGFGQFPFNHRLLPHVAVVLGARL